MLLGLVILPSDGNVKTTDRFVSNKSLDLLSIEVPPPEPCLTGLLLIAIK